VADSDGKLEHFEDQSAGENATRLRRDANTPTESLIALAALLIAGCAAPAPRDCRAYCDPVPYAIESGSGCLCLPLAEVDTGEVLRREVAP